MASRQLSAVLQHLRHITGGRGAADTSDGQLVERFVTHQDDSAFRLLLERYGPMVMGVCRRALGNSHDADDAFQATFLLLVRKAAALRQQDLVGNWLYGVAYRIARRARLNAGRRSVQADEVPDMASVNSQPVEDWHEVRPLLDEELQRLPRKYRVPLVLCYLEGKTNEATARQLRCPTGTLKTRLAKGRELLRARLERRGLALSAAGLAALLAPEALNAAAPLALVEATVEAASLGAAGGTMAAGAVTARVASLIEGAAREMLVAKLQTLALAILAVAMIGTGGGLLTLYALGREPWTVNADAGPAVTSPTLSLPIDDGGLADTVQQRVDDWLPTRRERRFDDIGWAGNLRQARLLAQKHGRPIFLLTGSGSIATGRCPASAANLRAGALSDDGVIDLLNRQFVPVYFSADQDAGAPEERADLERLRQEAGERQLSARANQAWALGADGRLLDALDACHATPEQLRKFLEAHQGARNGDATLLVAPTCQSRKPSADQDAVVLHLTARYLEQRDDDLVPLQVPLGKPRNYFMKGCPAENWIVLDRAQALRLLPVGAVAPGSTWDLDRGVAKRLFQSMYPPTEDNDLAHNRIDMGQLTATVVSRQGDVVRARIEGQLRMKHRFDPERDDNRFVSATLLGYLDFEPGHRLCSLRLITVDATYGKDLFGIAIRTVP